MNLINLLPSISRACDLGSIARNVFASNDAITVGVLEAAKPAVLAAIAREGLQLLAVAAKPQRALALSEELAGWLGDDTGVLLFPERDALPFERVAPDPEALAARLRALRAVQDSTGVVVASGIALAQRTLETRNASRIQLVLSAGTRTTQERLIMELTDLGYRMMPVVEQPGDLARRGGIIDVFPSTEAAPVRIELLGDQIESLRWFDPASQRSSGRLDQAAIPPAREVLGLARAVHDLSQRLDMSNMSAEHPERFEEELSRLAEDDALPDEGFYVPFLAQASLLDNIPETALLVIDEPAELAQALEEHDAHVASMRAEAEARGEVPLGLPWPHMLHDELQERLRRFPNRLALSRWATDGEEDRGRASTVVRLPFTPAEAYGGRLRALVSDVVAQTERGGSVIIVSQQTGRLSALLGEDGVTAQVTATPDVPRPRSVAIVLGSQPEGWALAASDPPLTLLCDREVFGFAKQRRHIPRRAPMDRDAFLAGLTPGQYVVHIDHGIARFAGLVRRRIGDIEREYLELHYDRGDKLFVPAEQIDRVSRFMGPSDQQPSLTRLGSQEWTRAKERVRRAVADLARELLELYASRQLVSGRSFSSDSAWQHELEASFPYVETPDQLSAIHEVKLDMERPRPMDRLVCGDVGYGKTEVAVRAAFKAVMDGSQVAILVPTTVLAQQHFNTFRERLAGFPARIEMLSRFRSDREQTAIVKGLASGSIDIVIGTHRLLQKDVSFKDLGLVIIDEEQRFGVGHKERLKQMRKEVDVLTLSATPIPRTLHMSLSGIRDMSTMETPPEHRLPIKTYVTEYDDVIVREAILRELERGGQVYFVHNRVHDIEMVTSQLRRLVPQADFGIAHGQQPEEQLARAMSDFTNGRIDVLVCTTIIESGLDIPNVNTIIVHKADQFGLAQLYQLRGRVGRGAARAYAYLLFDKYRALSETAQKRLQAIFEATELGSGFQIALRDLEIRGAGNLLGAEQSGQIGAVGFDLYVRLLGEAVERLKALREGRQPPPPKTQQTSPTIDLPFAAHLPPSYVGDMDLRLALYQRLAAVETAAQADEIAQEVRDRFGHAPPAAENLLFAVRVRALARQAGVTSVQQEEQMLVVRTADGLSPKEALRHMQVPHLSLGPTQARLDLTSLADRWPAALIDVLTALDGARHVPNRST
jgi:transcription-repair coupling factor (superfamily II helicase)